MDFNRIKKAYFIGIKGVGMTMLAQFMAAKGVEVWGSDIDESFMTDEVLLGAGIKISTGFSEANLPKEADLIVYSTAYNITNNPEVAAALRGRIRSLTYAEALAEIFNAHFGVAVCGSHGKTTTTAWLGFLLTAAGRQPSVMVGSKVPQFKGASLVGTSDLLVVEADEYQNKLKYFQPKVVLLNNIDYDHPDFFPTEADYLKVFLDFIKKLPPKGCLVANFDDENIRKYAQVNCRAKVVTYGLREGADVQGYDLKAADGRQYFKVRLRDQEEALLADSEADRLLRQETGELGSFSISLAGTHNVQNALAVLATGLELGLSLLDIRRHLGEFTGTARRLELLGEYRGAKVYDDYAHHPAEIKATLSAVRQLYPKNELVLVFHPHTFTRTKAFLAQFAESFALADELILLDIYGSAREQQGGVSSTELLEKIEALRPQGFAPKVLRHIPDKPACAAYLREHLRRDQVLVLMGAGDVFRIADELLK